VSVYPLTFRFLCGLCHITQNRRSLVLIPRTDVSFRSGKFYSSLPVCATRTIYGHGRLRFDSRQEREFSLLHRAQTDSGDRFWDSPSLLSNWYRELFPPGGKRRGMKLTTHLHLVPRSRIAELYLHCPIRLHGLMLN
jgi:hypothetical protein